MLTQRAASVLAQGLDCIWPKRPELIKCRRGWLGRRPGYWTGGAAPAG